jgi:4-hydroxy-tetrahydrodipicolinate reductase
MKPDKGIGMSDLPRIALYGTGQYGLEAVRIAIRKGWPIVAAFNRKGDKVGRDLGELAGLDRKLGVIVQDCDEADFNACGADVAIVAITDRLKQNMSAYERLLGAGIDVICHGAEAYFPWGADADLARVIDDLAKRRGATFTGTGIWDFSRIWSGIALAGPVTRITSLFHRALTNAEAATIQLAKVCGVSMTQDEFASRNMAMIGGLYKLVPHHVMQALGFHVTKVTETREPVLSDVPVYSRLFDKTFGPGTCLGVRIVSTVETQERVTAKSHSELRILPPGETEHMYWSIEGMPNTSVRVERTHSVHMSAACLVHRVPSVIAAAPGIRLVSQLGPLLPQAPFT